MTYQLKNLNVSSLDFSDIKSSLTEFFNDSNEMLIKFYENDMLLA
jgi:hypothetical protein